jgi:hypothetical protein
LRRHLLEQEAHWHQSVLHSGTKNLFGFGKCARDLVQTSDIVLVLLHRLERESKRQISETDMRAAHLANRHLVFFEVIVVDALLQRAQQNLVGHRILFGKAGRLDGFQAREKMLVIRVLGAECCQGPSVQSVIIPIIAVCGRLLRVDFDVSLIPFLEKRILSRDARRDVHRFGSNRCAASIEEERDNDNGEYWRAHDAIW